MTIAPKGPFRNLSDKIEGSWLDKNPRLVERGFVGMIGPSDSWRKEGYLFFMNLRGSTTQATNSRTNAPAAAIAIIVYVPPRWF